MIALHEIDRLFKEKYGIKRYVRYIDDGIAISNDKSKLKSLLDTLNF